MKTVTLITFTWTEQKSKGRNFRNCWRMKCNKDGIIHNANSFRPFYFFRQIEFGWIFNKFPMNSQWIPNEFPLNFHWFSTEFSKKVQRFLTAISIHFKIKICMAIGSLKLQAFRLERTKIDYKFNSMCTYNS